MAENPIQVLIYVVLAVYVLHLYRAEYRKRTTTAELETSLLERLLRRIRRPMP